MDKVYQFTLFAAGIFLLFLSYKMQRRNWKAPTWVCALLGILALIGSQAWVQGFFKTGILNFGYQYGEKLNEFQGTVGKIEETVRQHQGKLDLHQREIDGQHEKLKQTQASLLQAQEEIKQQQQTIIAADERIKNARAEMEIAQKTIAEQRKELDDVQYLVRNLFSRMQSEIFTFGDTNRMFVVENPPTNMNLKALVFFKLAHVPIKESISVQYHIYAQPPHSYLLANNIVMLRWGDSAQRTKENQFYVNYVADLTRSNEVVNLKKINDDLSIEADKPMQPMQFPRQP